MEEPAENGGDRLPERAAAAPAPKLGDFLGRHRLSAAIGRLQLEIQSLMSELEELDTMEPSSAVCQEVLSSMEGIPDALLPITKGPENSTWERWFQPVRSKHRWWNHRDSEFS
ncbi:Guanine nucleotide-binding protein subunit gamma 1 [Apostasia shenzhenica]|uniref:Guanine nucleotide-binding protein subunit gamma 1 n=1 Tax=Apostasia shenzhenica TaxID=1088818 RepID=A0A2I0AH71_9ASPA|nr:Guanine nucleotide-binding protein subunit gamma 1 [Apostasia shenzhenica]